ncbi:MAG TPA: OmpA family protein [Polyangiaceae bacterium]|nr:OmpA family protein [Polyangiaceae bacterium]
MSIQRIITAFVIGSAVAACSHQQMAAKAPQTTAATTSTPQPATRAAEQAVTVQASPKIRQACNLPDGRADSPLFDFDRSDLHVRGQTILDGVASCMQSGKLKGEDVHAIGFADPRGTEAYNMDLGTRRAQAARQYLEGQGVNAGRIGVATCGKHEATGTDEPTWVEDRRVELAMSDEALPSNKCVFDSRATSETANR